MIDIEKETLISFSEAARLLPGRTSPSTFWRWHRKGCRGIRLETIVIGSRRWVSREALQRFIDATTAAANPGVLDDPSDLGRSESTERRLKDAGLLPSRPSR